MMTKASHSLSELNVVAPADFVAALGEVFEHAQWAAQEAAAARPFASVEALHDALMQAVRDASHETKLAFIRGHPELAGKVSRAMTDASAAEQGSLGLDRLGEEEFARFGRLNRAYRERFGLPFIICVRRHTRDEILRQFERRLGNDAASELATALGEIAHITRLRLVGKVEGPGMPATCGLLTIHILDTFNGCPAAGVAVALHELGASASGRLTGMLTNADGRTDRPLLADVPLRIGTYELRIEPGGYFARRAMEMSAPAYLDTIPVRFSIAEPERHYHLAVQMTPWSYAVALES